MVMTKNARQMLMGDKEMSPDIFLESKDMRDKCINKIELLDKVKQIFLLPELECLTTKQMADYFEVGYEAIKSQYKNNQKEFDEDGVTLKKPSDFKVLNGLDKTVQKWESKRGYTVITLDTNTILEISNRGIKCFPKRAILRMGMLLQGSRVSQEVRTQLLNTFEHATEEQRTYEINKERKLRDDIWDAWGADDIDEVMKASAALDGYRKRHIAALEKKNADLAKKNEEISSDNKALTAENDIYAKEVLKWTDRASANRAVKVLAAMCFKGEWDKAWNTVYKELRYKYGIVPKARASGNKRKRSLLSYIRDDEWVYLFRVIAALCNQNNVNIKKLFEDAKINISDLDLSDKAGTC